MTDSEDGDEDKEELRSEDDDETEEVYDEVCVQALFFPQVEGKCRCCPATVPQPLSPRRRKGAQCQSVFTDESHVTTCRECQASLHSNCLRPHWASQHRGERLHSSDEEDNEEEYTEVISKKRKKCMKKKEATRTSRNER